MRQEDGEGGKRAKVSRGISAPFLFGAHQAGNERYLATTGRRTMKRKTVGFIAVFFLFVVPCVFAAEKPAVEIFSPQGTVKGVRQVTVRFSEQMVPFGDPRGLIAPFAIDCPEKGRGRWADGKNWVFDFEKDLTAGDRWTFRLK